jgi:lipopolysaccharide/colanic/teichoic acid biosynthesis glycosyltransferase
MNLASAAERVIALLGLLVSMPVLAIAAAAVLLEDGRPVLFRQRRLGRGGRPFLLLKLRSMRRASGGLQITAGTDPRITTAGRFLRKYKLDELPQLWNVARGEMSLIGPRPEVPDYVDPGDPLWREVLSIRPGISDLASLVYRNEQELLRDVADPDSFYRLTLLPRKLKLSLHYNCIRSLLTDIRLLLLTIRYSVFSSEGDPEKILKAFGYTEVIDWPSCPITNPVSAKTK